MLCLKKGKCFMNSKDLFKRLYSFKGYEKDGPNSNVTSEKKKVLLHMIHTPKLCTFYQLEILLEFSTIQPKTVEKFRQKGAF